MQGPFLLPQHLASYRSVETDHELFQSLTQNLDDLVLFFEYACEDEKWSQQHSKFLRLVLRWGAKQFYLGNLPLYYASQLVKIIQSHYALLRPFLFFRAAFFFNVRLRVENQLIPINCLLFGVSSPPLRTIFKHQCFEKLQDEWTLFNIRLPVFQQIEAFISRGEEPKLEKYEYGDIINLMNQAKTWELTELVKHCAQFLRRYIHLDNVVETILKAHQQGYSEWKEEAYIFFNQIEWGIRFIQSAPSDLKIEFLDFNAETLELFHLFAPWVTHLVFRGHLSEKSEYSRVLLACPELVGVDLSESEAFAHQFAALPDYVMELSLSSCPWLRPSHVIMISTQCPHLKKLELAYNPHLDSLTWGEFHRLKQLRILNLTYCSQLTDQNLKLIAQANPLLLELNIERCRKISDQGIAHLVTTCPHLHHINVGFCDQLSDQALKAMALHLSQLSHLKLTKCTELTDEGLQQLIKLRPTLRFLDVRECRFSKNALKFIFKNFPMLQVEY